MAHIKGGEEGGGGSPFTKPNMIQSLVSFDMSTRPKFCPHNRKKCNRVWREVL
jgi:hypothetical protein